MPSFGRNAEIVPTSYGNYIYCSVLMCCFSILATRQFHFPLSAIRTVFCKYPWEWLSEYNSVTQNYDGHCRLCASGGYYVSLWLLNLLSFDYDETVVVNGDTR
jgi:hypothetical protein